MWYILGYLSNYSSMTAQVLIFWALHHQYPLACLRVVKSIILGFDGSRRIILVSPHHFAGRSRHCSPSVLWRALQRAAALERAQQPHVQGASVMSCLLETSVVKFSSTEAQPFYKPILHPCVSEFSSEFSRFSSIIQTEVRIDSASIRIENHCSG